MKKTIFGSKLPMLMAAFVLVLALGLTGCEVNGNGNSGMVITVTGLSAHNGSYAAIQLHTIPDVLTGVGVQNWPTVARGVGPIRGGTVRVEIMAGTAGSTPFENAGAYGISLGIRGSPTGFNSSMHTIQGRQIGRFGGTIPFGDFN